MHFWAQRETLIEISSTRPSAHHVSVRRFEAVLSATFHNFSLSFSIWAILMKDYVAFAAACGSSGYFGIIQSGKSFQKYFSR